MSYYIHLAVLDREFSLGLDYILRIAREIGLLGARELRNRVGKLPIIKQIQM
jgi:hypothetical protein